MENKDNQRLDHLFRNLENMESTPPSASWAQMEALLDAQQGKKKRGMVWWWAAAAILPFLLVGGWWMGQHTNPEKPLVAIHSDSKTKPVEIEKRATPTEIQPIESTVSATESGKNSIKQLASSNSKGHFHHVREKKAVSQLPQPIINEPEIEIEKASNQTAVASQTEIEIPATHEDQPQLVSEDSESGIASIEFRPSSVLQEDSDVASVEWKQDQSTKRKLQNTWEKIKNTDPAKLAGIENAKESLLALLRF